MKKILITMALMLQACGDITVKTKDSKHTVEQTGNSYTYVVIRLEFIQQVKELCQAKNNMILDPVEFDRTVANCTFENLSLLNIDFGKVQDVQAQICGTNPINLTPEQFSVYNTLCQ